MNRPVNQVTPMIRCAIYTRKSTEEGLEQEFNSLDAQREAGESYIMSQKHEGWTVVTQRYDDGGFSGGNMDRPALERLLRDAENHRIDCVVVYKVDRLSRSLLDFSRIMEIFDSNGVSFVSVTQSFNTTSSMGRLTLNILLSFAQFEREIIGERIRDKVAAAKRKGKFTGGTPPLGYDVDPNRTALIVNPEEAKLVRHIFKRYAEVGSPITITQELNKKGITTKSWMTKNGVFREGKQWNKSHIYRVLHNRTYLGEVIHKDITYPGEHEQIVSRDLWDRVHSIIESSKQYHSLPTRVNSRSLLKGIIRCGSCDKSMSPVSAGTGQKVYRYYTCVNASKSGYHACPVKSVPAGDIENAVVQQLKSIFRTPEMIAQTYREAHSMETEEIDRLEAEHKELEYRIRILSPDDTEYPETKQQLEYIADELNAMRSRLITERDVAASLNRLGPIWDELFPLEQSRIIHLLVERVTINPDGMNIKIHSNGLHSLVSEVRDNIDNRKGS